MRADDALGAETPCCPGLLGGLGVRHDAELAPQVGVAEEGQHGPDRPVGAVRETPWLMAVDTGLGSMSRWPAYTSPVVPSTDTHGALGQADPAREGGHPGDGVDEQTLDPGDAGASEAAGHDGRVRGEPAAGGDHGARGEQATEVVGARLGPGQHDLAAESRPRHRRGRVEHELAVCRAGARREAVGERRRPLLGREGRVQQGLQLGPVDAGQGLVEVDDPSSTSSTAMRKAAAGLRYEPGLQDPQVAPLDGELDVAQVAVVLLERAQVPLSSSCTAGSQPRARRGTMCPAPTHDVLALGVGKVVAEDAGAPLTGSRVKHTPLPERAPGCRRPSARR